MIKSKKKCYIYTRVSTAIQVDGYSLDAQKDKLRKFAEYQEMEIVGEYSDEGFSGKNIKGRHEFTRMLNDIPKTQRRFFQISLLDSNSINIREHSCVQINLI